MLPTLKTFLPRTALLLATACLLPAAFAQIGTRFPAEKKVVPDPVTGIPVTFLTTTAKRDSKIYQTHHQWTADGKWLVFRSNRVQGEAMAVNEATGVMVQVTEGGFSGMLCLADNTMNLYFLRIPYERPAPPMVGGEPSVPPGPRPADAIAPAAGTPPRPGGGGGGPGGRGRQTGPAQIMRVDLGKLFADSEAGKLQPVSAYETACGSIPMEWGAGGDMALDCTEEYAYFRVGKEEAAKHLPAGTKPEENYGPRNMGAGPTGLGRMNLKTGAVNFVVAVPFQIGHVQTNPWVPGEIVFCWETGGKAPQRTWTVMGDGTGLRPLFPEASYDWVTHEAIVSKDYVAVAILSHRRIKIPGANTADNDGPGQGDTWGANGTGEHPTGLAMINLRTRELRIAGQTPIGDPGRSVWHVHGSPDGRWAVADDFLYRLWLYDLTSGDSIMLADLGSKTTAQDHIHPTFSADSTRIQVQTAMIAEDGRSLNIAVVPVPESWLKRTYPKRIVP
jgi:oligogalacturonide lyase